MAVFSLGQWSVSVCSCVPAMVHNNIVCLLCYTGIHAAPEASGFPLRRFARVYAGLSLRQRYSMCILHLRLCTVSCFGCGSLSTGDEAYMYVTGIHADNNEFLKCYLLCFGEVRAAGDEC